MKVIWDGRERKMRTHAEIQAEIEALDPIARNYDTPSQSSDTCLAAGARIGRGIHFTKNARELRGAREGAAMSKVKRIKLARNAVGAEISAMSSGGVYARGLASEGYSGGYRDALDDVLLLMNGVRPQRRNYWDGEKAERSPALREKESR